MTVQRRLTDSQLATWLWKAMGTAEWQEIWTAWQLVQVEAAITGCWGNEKVGEFARDTKAMRAFLAWCESFVKRKDGVIDGRAKRGWQRRTAALEGSSSEPGSAGS